MVVDEFGNSNVTDIFPGKIFLVSWSLKHLGFPGIFTFIDAFKAVEKLPSVSSLLPIWELFQL